MKKILFAAAFTFIIANDSIASYPGSSAFSFLKIDPSAKTSSLGSISTLVSPQTVVLNPAVLPWIEKNELTINNVTYLQNISYSMISMNGSIDKQSAAGLSIGYLGVSDLIRVEYDATSVDGYIEKEQFSYSDLLLNASYAKKVGRDTSLGVTAKFIQETIDNKNSNGYLLTLAGYYTPWITKWQISFGISNLGTQVKGYSVPTGIFVGMGKYTKPNFYWGWEGILYFDDVAEVKLGFEWQMIRKVFLRGGYCFSAINNKLGDSVYTDISAGIGFELDNIAFDYAWVPYGDLGQTHRITLGYKFSN